MNYGDVPYVNVPYMVELVHFVGYELYIIVLHTWMFQFEQFDTPSSSLIHRKKPAKLQKKKHIFGGSRLVDFYVILWDFPNIHEVWPSKSSSIFGRFFAPLWVRRVGEIPILVVIKRVGKKQLIFPNGDAKWWFFPCRNIKDHKTSKNSASYIPRRINVWYIYLHLPTFTIKINLNIGKYTVRPMDPHGYHSNLIFSCSRLTCPADLSGSPGPLDMRLDLLKSAEPNFSGWSAASWENRKAETRRGL